MGSKPKRTRVELGDFVLILEIYRKYDESAQIEELPYAKRSSR